MIESLYGKIEEEHKKVCVYCGSSIAHVAKLCPICKSSTSRFKNWVTYLGTIAGFITFVGSAVVFAIGRYPAARMVLFPHRGITVIEIDNGRASMNTAIQNNGDKSIYVSGIWMGDAATYRNFYDFDKIIPSGRVAVAVLRPNLEFPQGKFLTSLNGNIPQKAFDKFSDNESQSCFGIHFFSENAPALEDFKNRITKHGQRLATKPVPLDIVYYNLDDPKEQRFHNVVEEAFFHLPNPNLDCTTSAESTVSSQAP